MSEDFLKKYDLKVCDECMTVHPTMSRCANSSAMSIWDGPYLSLDLVYQSQNLDYVLELIVEMNSKAQLKKIRGAEAKKELQKLKVFIENKENDDVKESSLSNLSGPLE